jgi:hypothetical protein
MNIKCPIFKHLEEALLFILKELTVTLKTSENGVVPAPQRKFCKVAGKESPIGCRAAVMRCSEEDNSYRRLVDR